MGPGSVGMAVGGWHPADLDEPVEVDGDTAQQQVGQQAGGRPVQRGGAEQSPLVDGGREQVHHEAGVGVGAQVAPVDGASDRDLGGGSTGFHQGGQQMAVELEVGGTFRDQGARTPGGSLVSSASARSSTLCWRSQRVQWVSGVGGVTSTEARASMTSRCRTGQRRRMAALVVPA